jgi:hypothetical protein
MAYQLKRFRSAGLLAGHAPSAARLPHSRWALPTRAVSGWPGIRAWAHAPCRDGSLETANAGLSTLGHETIATIEKAGLRAMADKGGGAGIEKIPGANLMRRYGESWADGVRIRRRD